MPQRMAEIKPAGSRVGGAHGQTYAQRKDKGRPLEQNYFALQQKIDWLTGQNRKLKKENEQLRRDMAVRLERIRFAGVDIKPTTG
jgi:hypothetical protein